MIPLGSEFVSGYYLVSEHGDVYCFGDIDFYGTISSVYHETPTIVASFAFDHGIQLVSNNGEIFTLANHGEKISVPGATEVVDAIEINGVVVLCTQQGVLIDQAGLTIDTLGTDTAAQFIACSLASNGKDVYGLDDRGRVYVSGEAQHYGDIETLGNKDVHAVDIACSPWGNGYWLIDEIGGVFCFGETDYFGSVPGDGRTCVAKKIVPSPTGHGYWIVDNRGMLLAFGDATYCGHPLPGQVTGNIADIVPVIGTDRRDAEWLFTQLVDNDMAQLLGEPLEEFSEPIAP